MMFRLMLRTFWKAGRYLRPRIAKVRYILYAPAFARAGLRGSIGRRVSFHDPSLVSLGDGVAFRDDCLIGGAGRILIGSQTAVNAGCILAAMDQISIGSNVMLAPRVYVLDVDHEFAKRSIPISHQGYRTAPVEIGDGAWIGTGAVITKGVTIGEGAIVGANSVVTRDVPPYTIVGGVPAKLLRERPE